MQVPLLIIPALLLVVASGCGGVGGTDGGAAGLPNRGIVPYEKLAPVPDSDVGFLFPEAGSPSAIAVEGGVALFFDLDGDVHRADSTDGLTFGSPRLVLEEAAAPAVIRITEGFVHAWVDGEGVRVARSDSVDDFGPSNVLLSIPGAASPSPVWDGESLWIYTVEAAGVILRRVGLDGGVLDEAILVLASDEACIDGIGDPCWDRMGVHSVEVRRATTPLGRTVFRMMYAGAGTGFKRGIGFAASFDGRTFTRYPFNPAFSDSGRESEPSNLRVGDRYLLYFRDRVIADEGIGVAEIVTESPADSF